MAPAALVLFLSLIEKPVLRIRDVYTGSQITILSIPDPGSRVKKIPNTESASKNLNIFNPKNFFRALGKIIWDIHPGSGFFPLPDPRGRNSTGSRIRGILKTTGKQCGGSGMFIPDPDFYPSRISDPKTATKDRGEKKMLSYLFFVAPNFTKLLII